MNVFCALRMKCSREMLFFRAFTFISIQLQVGAQEDNDNDNYDGGFTASA